MTELTGLKWVSLPTSSCQRNVNMENAVIGIIIFTMTNLLLKTIQQSAFFVNKLMKKYFIFNGCVNSRVSFNRKKTIRC